MNHIINKDCIFYFICICIGATAYQFYSEGLSQLHWTFAGFLFSMSSWLSVRYFHYPTKKWLHKKTSVQFEKTNSDKKWNELTKVEIITILILAIFSFGNFALMLPFLNNQDTAIYFTIIGSTLVRFTSILIAQKLFQDKIENRYFFWIGLIICVLGIGIYNYRKLENNTFSNTILISSLLWGCLSILADQSRRFVTIPFSKRKVKIILFSDTYLSIKTLQEKSELIKTVLFGVLMLFSLAQRKFVFHFLTIRELLSVLWIGYIVTIWGGTISQEFKNKIGETIASIFFSLRVVSSLIFAPFIAMLFLKPHPFEIWTDGSRWLAITIMFIGSYLSLVKGKPKLEDLKPQLD